MAGRAVLQSDRFHRHFIEGRKPDPAIDYPAYRREPGGLELAVLYAVGDGYPTSLKVALLLETTIDNVNGALRRLESEGHIERASAWSVSPVAWAATEGGRAHLRQQMAEGFD